MSNATPGGILDIEGSPHIRVSTTDSVGIVVFVYTSVYEHTSEAEREEIAEAQHLYPACYDYNMLEMGTLC